MVVRGVLGWSGRTVAEVAVEEGRDAGGVEEVHFVLGTEGMRRVREKALEEVRGRRRRN